MELLGGTDQTKIGNSSDSLKVSVTNPVVITGEAELATFCACLYDVASDNNKSLLSLVNTTGSDVRLKIREIRIINTRNAPVTGVVADIQLLRCTSHSGGTSITPGAYDTSDTLNGHITARTGATISGESAVILRHWDISTDEWGPGSNDVESTEHTLSMLIPSYTVLPKTKPLTLNANEGFTFKCVTNTTTGLFDITVVFTQE
jgi:hypothetical protein